MILDISNLDTKLSECIKEQDQAILELINSGPEKYDDFFPKFNIICDKVSQLMFPLSVLNSTCHTDETENMTQKCSKILSNFYTNLGQNEDLYNLYLKLAYTNLTEIQKKIISDSLISFKLSGVGLSEDKKNKILEINEKLSLMSNEYSTNVLKATNEYTKIIKNENDVIGIPQDILDRCKIDEGWQFGLDPTTYSAYIEYGPNREIREELYKANCTRAPKNEKCLEDILQLKYEKAKVLEFSNWAQVSLETKMAESPEQIIKFLKNLGELTLPFAKEELKKIIKFAEKNNFTSTFEQYDLAYWKKKYEEHELNYSEEKYKSYFELNKTLNNFFKFLKNFLQIEFVEFNENMWHESVKCFNIFRNDEKIAQIFLDLEWRKNKKPGAWMDSWTSGYKDLNGNKILPKAIIVCNFTPATKNLPALLTPDEVTTLFHEMGHALQHICSYNDDMGCSGIDNIEWDAVEWMSQFMECFFFEPEILELMAVQYINNTSLPKDMQKTLIDNKNFCSGLMQLKQVEYALFDIIIHSMENSPSASDVQKILDDLRKDYALLPVPKYNKFQNSFSHIFCGGYSAGYYSYKWAEVLSCDTFFKFKDNGIFNKNLADEFFNKILSKGSSISSMSMFTDFMGRDPDNTSLMKYLNLC